MTPSVLANATLRVTERLSKSILSFVDLFSDQLGRDTRPAITDIRVRIKDLVDLVLDRFKKQVSGSIGSGADKCVSVLVEHMYVSICEHMEAKREFTAEPSFCGELLPANTRLHFSRGLKHLFLVEIPPHCRTLNFSRDCVDKCGGTWDTHKEDPGLFHLSLPYMLFLASVDEIREPHKSAAKLCVYFRNQPFCSMNDKLYACILPNTFDSNQICLGGYKSSVTEPAGVRVRLLIDYYFQSEFNLLLSNGVYWHWAKEHNPCFTSLSAWEQATRKDPSFILQSVFPPADLTGKSLWDDSCRKLYKSLDGFAKTPGEVSDSLTLYRTELRRAIVKACEEVKTEDLFEKEQSERLESLLINALTNALKEAVHGVSDRKYIVSLWDAILDELSNSSGYSHLKRACKGQFFSGKLRNSGKRSR